MSLAEEIRRVLLEHPEILVEVLTARPHIVYEALAKLLPWEKLMKEIEEIKNTMAKREELEKIGKRLEEIESRMATKEDLGAFATKEDLKAFATKEDLKAFATKEDLAALERRLNLRIEALGAMWGVWSEEAFREGVRELLREAGYVVERWTYFDDKGQVYGYPSEVELDVVVKDGKIFLVEIVSAQKLGIKIIKPEEAPGP